ncbi:MAG: peptidoglycan hydrolase CwlO-like protein, partial [Mariniblastus sp.]
MKSVLSLTVLLALIMFFGGQEVSAQQSKNKQSRAERELAVELANEKRLDADLKALKANEGRIQKEMERLQEQAQTLGKRAKAMKGKAAVKQQDSKAIKMDAEQIEKWVEKNGSEMEAW